MTDTEIVTQYIDNIGRDCPQCDLSDYHIPTIDPNTINDITCGVCGWIQQLHPEVLTRIKTDMLAGACV